MKLLGAPIINKGVIGLALVGREDTQDLLQKQAVSVNLTPYTDRRGFHLEYILVPKMMIGFRPI